MQIQVQQPVFYVYKEQNKPKLKIAKEGFWIQIYLPAAMLRAIFSASASFFKILIVS